MRLISVRNWTRYQHHGNLHSPPWIKTYAHLLADKEDHALPIATRLLWRQLLLLAAKHNNLIPANAQRIAEETHMPIEEVKDGVRALLRVGWLVMEYQPPGEQKKTGWRFVRGTHSGTYMRDPQGRDMPPFAARSETLEVG